MNMNDTYTDMLGQIISVGDYVVYATTSDWSPVVKYAIVDNIGEKPESYWILQDNKRVASTRMVPVVGVRQIMNSRNFWAGDGSRVSYPIAENIIKVNVTPEMINAVAERNN